MVVIFTAVGPQHVSLLPEACESILQQDIPWSWLITIDGPYQSDLPKDPRISIETNHAHQGISILRNRMLASTSEKVIVSLDADDKLVTNSLTKWVAPFEENPDIGYVATRSLDWFPDGQLLDRFRERPYVPGKLEKSQLETVWWETKNVHLQPGAVAYNRQALLAVGGWTALSAMEDQDALLAVSFDKPGFYLEEHVYHYRQHANQTVHTEEFAAERVRSRKWTSARLDAMRPFISGKPQPPREVPLPTPEEAAAVTTSEWKQVTEAFKNAHKV